MQELFFLQVSGVGYVNLVRFYGTYMSPSNSKARAILQSPISCTEHDPTRMGEGVGNERDKWKKALVCSVKRTSNLEAPIVSLSRAHGVSFQGQCLLGTQKNALTGGDNKL